MRVGLFCELLIKPECMEEFLPIMQEHSTACPAEEEGCILFRVGRDRDDPNLIRIYEEYVGQADVDLHNSTDRFFALNAKIEPMMDSVVVYTVDLPW
ncbi:MAG: putative quinol monooxygenase [bacterium]|nr:putative quinol monooxygenase [bacterium]